MQIRCNCVHYFSKVIDDRIQQRKEYKFANGSTSKPTAFYSSSNRRIRAFLDLLLEEYDQGNITKEGVREEVDTFMFEVSKRFDFRSISKNLIGQNTNIIMNTRVLPQSSIF